MKQNNITDLPQLESSRYENIFNVYKDSSTDVYYYNILTTVNFDTANMSPSVYEMYTVEAGDSYTYISYKHYGTINLWWLVCSFNSIHNPTQLPTPGTSLKILNREHVVNILTRINNT